MDSLEEEAIDDEGIEDSAVDKEDTIGVHEQIIRVN